jgi:SAM-dependent methyltransferase
LRVDVTDPTERFSDRASDYVKARPSYPSEVLGILRAECALRERSVVADLGSGTGIFTRLLLDSGARVHAVEPNDEMRAAAERALGSNPRFSSVRGRAEATTLPKASVDLATAAQAFHWFDVEATRHEMYRIVRPGGHVALVWNDRDVTSTPFLRELESLLVAHCPKYPELQGKADAIAKFDSVFGAGRWKRSTVPNDQRLDREGLIARVMSASYAPKAGTRAQDAIVAELGKLHDRHADNGSVRIAYLTVIVSGRIGAT